MIAISEEQRRHAFSTWLRTGYWPVARDADGTELKFNPWHDPRDGRFTFANSGNYYGRSLGGGGFSGGGGASGSWETPGERKQRGGTARARVSGAIKPAQRTRPRQRRQWRSRSNSARTSCATDMITNSTRTRGCGGFPAISTPLESRLVPARPKHERVALIAGGAMTAGIILRLASMGRPMRSTISRRMRTSIAVAIARLKTSGRARKKRERPYL